MSELKPCPFCGGKAEINAWATEDYDDGDAMISCEKCEAKTSIYVSTEYAAEAWNRRPSDALEAENKALRDGLKFYADRENYNGKWDRQFKIDVYGIFHDSGNRARALLAKGEK